VTCDVMSVKCSTVIEHDTLANNILTENKGKKGRILYGYSLAI